MAVLVLVSLIWVRVWRVANPGSMTVLEAQSMDMSTMEPAAGPVPVATEVVRYTPFSAQVTYTGSVAPLQGQIIYPRVDGRLTQLRVYNGSRVSANEILAVIDSPDIGTRLAEASAGYSAALSGIPIAQSDAARSRDEYLAAQADNEVASGDLARAEGMAAAARQSVAQAEKQAASAAANRDYWRAEIAREERLQKAGAVSLQEYQSEKAQALVAEAELGNQEAKLAEAKANVKAVLGDVAGKRAAVRAARQRASAARAAMTSGRQQITQRQASARQAGAAAATAAVINEYRYVRAPFAGSVTRRYMSPGQLVTTGTAVLDVVQIDRVRLQANVADKDLPSISVGAPVVARFAKYTDLVLSANITSISPLANQNSRTAVVEAIAPNPGHRLVPGDSVTLSITTSRSENATTVPVNAVVQRNGKSAVWVVRSANMTGAPRMPGMPGESPSTKGKPNSGTMSKVAHLVMVSLGASNGRRTEVLYGLMPGDEVIYQGNTYLSTLVRKFDDVYLCRSGCLRHGHSLWRQF
ncbi:MAG: efflux RND transporter periplasmic adaptor subunit [Armatimonadetes bacterium]|nr:efflux RND transporter periplasmic adaptor subunit [Armatimonadota bacterium]